MEKEFKKFISGLINSRLFVNKNNRFKITQQAAERTEQIINNLNYGLGKCVNDEITAKFVIENNLNIKTIIVGNASFVNNNNKLKDFYKKALILNQNFKLF